jgi:hypothetical protein
VTSLVSLRVAAPAAVATLTPFTKTAFSVALIKPATYVQVPVETVPPLMLPPL